MPYSRLGDNQRPAPHYGLKRVDDTGFLLSGYEVILDTS